MKTITHLSFSQIKAYRDCPKSWYVQKVLGEEQPQSDVAERGSQTDQLIGFKMNLCKAPTEPLAERVEEAVELYFNNGGWTHADEAQRKIELSPNSWDVYRELYGVDYTLPLPLVGYIDLYRICDNGIQRELCDIKTSTRAEFRPDWALQNALYSLVERAKWHVHLITYTKQIKLVKYEYRPTDATFKWAMNIIGETSNRMVETARITDADKIPATPGYHCQWCPRQLHCEGGLVNGITQTRE